MRVRRRGFCFGGAGAAFSFFAAGHDGGAEAGAEVVGELVDFVAAVDFDGFAGGVDDDFAVVASAEVLFDFGEQLGFDLAIEKIGEFGEEIRAVHWVASFFCRK